MVSMTLAMHLTRGFPASICCGKMDGGLNGKSGRRTLRSMPLGHLIRESLADPGFETVSAGGVTS